MPFSLLFNNLSPAPSSSTRPLNPLPLLNISDQWVYKPSGHPHILKAVHHKLSDGIGSTFFFQPLHLGKRKKEKKLTVIKVHGGVCTYDVFDVGQGH